METISIEPIVEEQTSAAVTTANAVTITDQDTYDQASEALSQVKQASKLVTSKKDLLTKPLNAALKEARELYRPFEEELSKAETIIKSKMVTYYNEKQAEARRKEAQLEARVEKGTMKVETAISKAEKIERVETAPGQTMRQVRQVRIVDLAQVPTKYFADPRVQAALLTAVRADALAVGTTGIVIPGVEVFLETQAAVR